MLKATASLPTQELGARHLRNSARDLPWINGNPKYARRRLAVVGGGQSAEDCLSELKRWRGHIMAINGAYDWLRDNGVCPDWFMGIDPSPRMSSYVTKACKRTRFVLGTVCHDDLFAALAGQHVELCGILQEEFSAIKDGIPGGPTAMCRAPLVARRLGYRRVTLFGADSCYRTTNAHVYDDEPSIRLDRHPIFVRCNGAVWLTDVPMLAQAEYICASNLGNLYDGLDIEIRGDNLAGAMIRSYGMAQVLGAAYRKGTDSEESLPSDHRQVREEALCG